MLVLGNLTEFSEFTLSFLTKNFSGVPSGISAGAIANICRRALPAISFRDVVRLFLVGCLLGFRSDTTEIIFLQIFLELFPESLPENFIVFWVFLLQYLWQLLPEFLHRSFPEVFLRKISWDN